jgi:hypothetical protein
MSPCSPESHWEGNEAAANEVKATIGGTDSSRTAGDTSKTLPFTTTTGNSVLSVEHPKFFMQQIEAEFYLSPKQQGILFYQLEHRIFHFKFFVY